MASRARTSNAAKQRAKTSAAARARGRSLRLYGHWLSHPALRVALMLHLTQMPYAYTHIDLLTDESQRPPYKKINRWGQVPTLVYRGESLCQSARILEFLAAETGRFDGRSAIDKRLVREWLNWCDDRLANLTRTRSAIRFVKGGPEAIRYIRGHAKLALDALNAHLEGRDFIVGKSLTIADIAAYPAVAHAGEARFKLKDWPNVLRWRERMASLSGVSDPYDLLPQRSRAIVP